MLSTRYSDSPLLFLEVLASAEFAEPLRATFLTRECFASSLFRAPAALHRPRLATATLRPHAAAQPGSTASDVARLWAPQFGLQEAGIDEMPALSLPTPHAVLVVSRTWSTYAVPLPRDRRQQRAL
eukprot:9555250-Alexandrium_andersonii.AAC.1